MARRILFNVKFSSEERQTLESMARKYTSPYCDVIRAKIILLADEGLSNDVIASRLDAPRQIVSKWRKQFALARLPGLEAQPRGGREARFSPQVSSFRLRHSPASFLTPSGSHCPGSRSRKSASTLFRKAWLLRSVARVFGRCVSQKWNCSRAKRLLVAVPELQYPAASSGDCSRL